MDRKPVKNANLALGCPTPCARRYAAVEAYDRQQKVMEKYFGKDISGWPSRLTIAPQWRPLNKGGLDDLREWCMEVERPTLITTDTLQVVRPEGKAGKIAYTVDYEANKGLLERCHEFPGLATMWSVHDRKAGADDVFDTSTERLGCPAALTVSL